MFLFFFFFLSLALKASITLPTYKGEQSVEDRFNINGHTSLHLASENGHKEMVEFLLQEGADIHALDHWDYSALHRASENGTCIRCKNFALSGQSHLPN